MAKRITEDTLRQHGFAIPEGGVGNISDETRHLLNIYLNRPDVSSQYLDIQLAKKGRAGRIPLKRDVASRVQQLESQSTVPKTVPKKPIPVSDSSAFKSASAARAPYLPIDPDLKRAARDDEGKAPPTPERKPFRKLISDIAPADKKQSLAAARKAGHLYYWKDGKKMAAVTREDLKESNLDLTDYMNKQLDKKRRKAPVPRKRPEPPEKDTRRAPADVNMKRGGMTRSKSRTGHMDYRGGGMVYSTKLKRG
jgi:hypothetical protein